MSRKENLIRLAVGTALGVTALKLGLLNKVGPSLRDKILEQIASKTNYQDLAGSDAIDSFCYPIPGGEGALAVKLTDLIADPEGKWEDVYQYRPSLSGHGTVTYMDVCPANQKWVPRWFLLREHIESQRLSSSYEHLDGETQETTRTYLIGRRHLPIY